MNNVSSFVRLSVILVVLIAVLPVMASGASNSESLKGEVLFVDSPVQYRSGDQKDWVQIDDTGTKLPKNGDLKVGDDGYIKIESSDNDRIRLNEQTAMAYQMGKQDTRSLVKLIYGSLKANASKRGFDEEPSQVQTATATVGIRGTVFGVSYEKSKQMEAFVEEGSVEVSASRGEKPVLKKGQSAEVKDGEEREIRTQDTIPKRLELTWDHYSYQKKKKMLEERIDKLEERKRGIRDRIRQRDYGPGGRDKLRNRMDTLDARLDELRSKRDNLNIKFGDVQEEYKEYRRQLAKERGEFIRKRLKALEEFREKRIKEMREQQRQREKEQREMRKERREQRENYEDEFEEFRKQQNE
ncbi:MAG: FecR domain-containing protein [bacterium]